MAEKYYSILTNRGKELEAQSSATGRPVIIKDFVVGDGNGQPVKPDPTRTALVHEVYRHAISRCRFPLIRRTSLSLSWCYRMM